MDHGAFEPLTPDEVRHVARLARLRLSDAEVEQYRHDREAAKKLIHTGDSQPDASLDVVELAAYTGISNMVLNLDEVISKE